MKIMLALTVLSSQLVFAGSHPAFCATVFLRMSPNFFGHFSLEVNSPKHNEYEAVVLMVPKETEAIVRGISEQLELRQQLSRRHSAGETDSKYFRYGRAFSWETYLLLIEVYMSRPERDLSLIRQFQLGLHLDEVSKKDKKYDERELQLIRQATVGWSGRDKIPTAELPDLFFMHLTALTRVVELYGHYAPGSKEQRYLIRNFQQLASENPKAAIEVLALYEQLVKPLVKFSDDDRAHSRIGPLRALEGIRSLVLGFSEILLTELLIQRDSRAPEDLLHELAILEGLNSEGFSRLWEYAPKNQEVPQGSVLELFGSEFYESFLRMLDLRREIKVGISLTERGEI